ncbi:response regulator [Coraliomargarita algicola]|uniref:histidine kinase n=1 Tax=Coraliomargarita algicola TaxID=3092156 RepID=A0ABZ0RGR0_9BACT|nr:ATP-binding protein [Coraliomargarita sp. J2-16]WPJ95306.1 response regulator [Coraliomargarita sp. J2-16]
MTESTGEHSISIELETLLKSTPFPMWVAAPNGQVTRINKPMRKALNLADGENIEHYNVLEDEDLERAGFLPKVKSVFEQHTSIRFGTPWSPSRTPVGTDQPEILTIYIDVVMFPILDLAGTLQCVVCQWTETADQALTQQRTERLSHLLKEICTINKLIARENDLNSLITQCCDLLIQNYQCKRAWCALKGASEEVAFFYEAAANGLPLHVSERVSQHEMPACYQMIAQSTQDLVKYSPGEPAPACCLFPNDCDNLLRITVKLSNHNKDYGIFAIATPTSALSETEEISFVEEICNDLSQAIHRIELQDQQKNAYLEMERAKVLAESANKAKSEFLAVMSHEMRTPLNPIMGYTAMLLEDSQGENAEMLQTILSESERMLTLVNQVLEYSRLNRGHIKPKKSPTRLLETCQDRLNQAQLNAPHLQLHFQNGDAHLQPINEDLRVQTDAHMLKSLINILLENACKYTQEGTVQLTIGQKTQANDEYQFIIQDTGIGIDEALLQKLFKPFSQVDASYKRNYPGIGLGLATCHKLVNIMGGRIDATSREGEGSCFTVTLPLQPIAEAKVENRFQELDRGLNILVVEDEFTNAQLMERTLSLFGCQSTIAANGQIAVQLAQENKYDLILMDLSMPLLDGFDATKEIKSTPTNRQTPVIALTANVESSTEQRCLDYGMSDFITKPINLQLFREKIARYIA